MSTAESIRARFLTRRRSLLNLCNLPPWVIGSHEFNSDPRPIELDGVRASNRFLFEKLEATDDPARRGEVFNEYMSVRFALHQWNDHEADARRSLRNSYVRFLRGWGVDSNSIEGAVLKSWAQSRFGLHPTYHKGRLLGEDPDADMVFAADRMKGSARTNAIYSQLDVLYEFCQYELLRRTVPGPRIKLYRGTYDASEYPVIERGEKRRSCVLCNNLSSFTTNREFAWEFGSTVWEVEIPLAKIFFFSGLLPDSLLRGEDEYVVLGGEYWVRELIY